MKKTTHPSTSFHRWLLPTLLLGAATTAHAQNNVGIGTNAATPAPSAVLDVSSTTQGLLIPRMTASQRGLIGSPATGLLVYQTDGTAGFYFYNGTAWTTLNGAAGATGATGPQGPQGATGPQGTAGTNGTNGTNGQGVPTGGTAGQVLTKIDATNYNTQWTTPGATGGGARLELLARKLATTQTLPLSGTNAVADVVVFENVATSPTSGTYNTSTNTYTAGVAGLYLIQVEYTMVETSPSSNTVGTFAYVEVNGGSSITNNVYPPYITNGSVGSLLPTGLKGIGSYNYFVFLNQNDAVRIKAFGQNSGTQQTMNNNGGCQLMVVKL